MKFYPPEEQNVHAFEVYFHFWLHRRFFHSEKVYFRNGGLLNCRLSILHSQFHCFIFKYSEFFQCELQFDLQSNAIEIVIFPKIAIIIAILYKIEIGIAILHKIAIKIVIS